MCSFSLMGKEIIKIRPTWTIVRLAEAVTFRCPTRIRASICLLFFMSCNAKIRVSYGSSIPKTDVCQT